MDCRKNVTGSRNHPVPSPKEGVSLEHLRNQKQAKVAGGCEVAGGSDHARAKRHGEELGFYSKSNKQGSDVI